MRHGRPSPWIAVMLLVAAACTSATKQSISGRSATLPGPPASFASSEEPTIAFHSDPGGRDDTYVMSGSGNSVVAVTDSMETVAQPYWSPDGARLVVSCCASGFGRLFLVEGPGSEPVELAPDTAGAANPAWSPDGSTIAFESTDDGSLYLVDVSGSTPGTPRPLGLSGAGPSWSPDGERIAYFAVRRGAPDIYTAAADGTDAMRLTRNTAPDYSPRWSSDGRIAFVSERDGDQDIYVMEADGSDQLDVSRNPWPDDFPAWSPDGRLIAYVSYQDGSDPLTIGDGNAEIFVVSFDGSDRQNVTSNPAWDGDPSWSPDGSEIAFTRRTEQAQVLVMQADGNSERKLRGVRGTANDCCPAWRP
jgi:Tol biopolymer transport system component